MKSFGAASAQGNFNQSCVAHIQRCPSGDNPTKTSSSSTLSPFENNYCCGCTFLFNAVRLVKRSINTFKSDYFPY